MVLDLLDDANGPVQDHLLQLNHVLFKGNRIYCHRLLHINYTSYDLQRDFDSISTRTDHRDIMLLSNSGINAHPFCYEWVLGIFHVNIIYTGPGSKDFQSCRIEFLWVQWFEVLQDHFLAWGQHTLNMVRFLPMADKHTFGFVDPPMCSEAATSFLHLQMVGSTLMALQCLVVQAMQMTGGVIISTGERLKSV